MSVNKKIWMTQSSIATFPKLLLSKCLLACKIGVSVCAEVPLMNSASWYVAFLEYALTFLLSTNGTVMLRAMGNVRGKK